jgi:transcriptional regulator with XRE-family HTH domain
MSRRSPTRKRELRKLYIGPWLARCGKKQSEAAAHLGVTATYISELVSNTKKNPEHGLLYDLSIWLGITMNDLYKPPPPKSAVDAVDKDMTPADQAALGTLLDRLKKTAR